MKGIGVHVCRDCGTVHDTVGAYMDCEDSHELARLRAVADAAQAVYHQYHTGEGLRPEDPEWATLGAALDALDGGNP